MIRLRQEFDSLLEDKDLYFSGSSDRGERHLVIKSKCGKVLYTFYDIVFTKLTKKDLEYIRELIEPRMKKINDLLKKIKIKEEELFNVRDIFYKKDKDKGSIRVWNSSIHLGDNGIYFDDDMNLTHYSLKFKDIKEASDKMKFLMRKLKEWREVVKLENELKDIKKELTNGCSI